MIDINKKYRYACGHPATVLTTECPGSRPVVSYCKDTDSTLRHDEDGENIFDRRYDLVEIPEWEDLKRGDLCMVPNCNDSLWWLHVYYGEADGVPYTMSHRSSEGEVYTTPQERCRPLTEEERAVLCGTEPDSNPVATLRPGDLCMALWEDDSRWKPRIYAGRGPDGRHRVWYSLGYPSDCPHVRPPTEEELRELSMGEKL